MGSKHAQLIISVDSLGAAAISYGMGIGAALVLPVVEFAQYSFIFSYVMVLHGLGLAMLLEPFITTNRLEGCRDDICLAINMLLSALGGAGLMASAKAVGITIESATCLGVAFWIFMLNQAACTRKLAYLVAEVRIIPLALMLSSIPMFCFVAMVIVAPNSVSVNVLIWFTAITSALAWIPHLVNSKSQRLMCHWRGMGAHLHDCSAYLLAATMAHLALSLPLLIGPKLTTMGDYGHVRIYILCSQPTIILAMAWLNRFHGELIAGNYDDERAVARTAQFKWISFFVALSLISPFVYLIMMSFYWHESTIKVEGFIFCFVWSICQSIIGMCSIIMRFDRRRLLLSGAYFASAVVSLMVFWIVTNKLSYVYGMLASCVTIALIFFYVTVRIFDRYRSPRQVISQR